jgi:hypothetical protein
VRDSVEAFGEVGVEDVFGLEADEVEDGLYGVVGIDNPLPSRIPAPQPALSEAEGSAYPYHYSRALASWGMLPIGAYGLVTCSGRAGEPPMGSTVPCIHFARR